MLITVNVRTCLRKVGKMQVLRRTFLLYLNANFFITESVANSDSSAPASFGCHCAGPSFILLLALKIRENVIGAIRSIFCHCYYSGRLLSVKLFSHSIVVSLFDSVNYKQNLCFYQCTTFMCRMYCRHSLFPLLKLK